MIEAKHNLYAEYIFRKYIYRLLKNNFFSLNLIGDFPEINNELPVILAPNHSTWWDGFFVYILNQHFFQRKFYIMILEEQLIQYKFFQKIGGYSISQDSPKSIIQSLEFTSKIMRLYPNSLITIFPQGKLFPSFKKPLFFKKGIEKVIKLYGDNVTVLPLSIRIEFLNEEKPNVYFAFGTPFISNGNDNDLIQNIENKVALGMDYINNSILNSKHGQIIIDGKKSISQKSKNFFQFFRLNNND
jgi:1-acyl-sn-glycerol-3-phosphate acyltransferase